MFDRAVKSLGTFSSAVLTARDAEGYPFSIRCQPEPDLHAQSFRVRVPEGAPLEPGAAGLLCHTHDELLWHQRSFLLRGSLERDADGWVLRPSEFIPGAGAGGIFGLVRFILGARGTTKRYLAKRGLRRPAVPWKELKTIQERAKRHE